MTSSILRASQTERWVNCPSSVRLMRLASVSGATSFDESYALEGSLAHEFVALEVERMLTPNYDMDMYNTRLQNLQANPVYNREMLDHVEAYLDVVRGILNDAQANREELTFSTESVMQANVNGVSIQGTSDFIAESDTTLHIVDYKYGMGIPVSAINNHQLMMYAILNSLETGKTYKRICLYVVQPRINNISLAEYDQSFLQAFGQKIVNAIDMVLDQHTPPTVGSWCKYCTAKATCPAQKEKLDDLESLGLLPSLLSNSELSKALKDAEYIISWLKDVQEYCYSKAINGYAWPGFKLVETRRRRVITDTEAAAATLLKAGYRSADVFETKLLPITKLEKAIGKNEFNDLLKPYLALSEQKFDLVDIADKRPAANVSKPGDEF